VDLIVENPSSARWGQNRYRCAIGKNGIIDAEQKREGDAKTPAGRWVMREVFYRADRVAKPETRLPVRVLSPDDAWSEDPKSPDYNKLIKRACTEDEGSLWRNDHLYDYLVILGYNDQPVQPGMGSAIFFHLARETYGPTAGCVTLSMPHMLTVLRDADKNSCVSVLKA
jgi:L,D-peptidoglycan transpeptidase YkuD (ErfK/YbiS/YcfS/YnhG family)